MLAYILDDSFIRTSVVEKFSSFIWTERYDTLGDCEMHIAFSADMYTVLNTGTYLSVDESKYLMEIKTVSLDTDNDGALIIKVIGESAERIFADRVSANLFAQNSTIRFEGKPAEIGLEIARRSFEARENEVFRENILIGGKLDFTQGWIDYYIGCSTSVSNGVLTITPSDISDWHTRGPIGDTDNFAHQIEAGKSYILQAETSRPVQFGIAMQDGGTGTLFFTDSNNIITIPEEFAGQKVQFLKIYPISGDSDTSPITIKNPTLEEYKGYFYNTPFNGSTPDADGVTYSWSGRNNNQSVLKNSTGTIIRTNLAPTPRTTKDSLVGSYKPFFNFWSILGGWNNNTLSISPIADSSSPSHSGYITRMTRSSSTSLIADELYRFITNNNTQSPNISLNKPYTVSFYVRSSVAMTVRADLVWLNSTGSSLADVNDVNGATTTIPPNTWTRLSATGTTSNPSAVKALTRLTLVKAVTLPANGTIDIDAHMVEQTDAVGTYFDGDYTSTAGATSEWVPVAKKWSSLASGRVWTLPGTDSNYNIIFDNNQVGYKGTLAFPTDITRYETGVNQTLKLLEDFCQSYGLGFSLTIRQLTSAARTFYFGIYKGTDRTTNQTAVEPVIFSKDFENLTNTSEIKSIAQYKNVCVVSSSAGSVVVYADGLNEGQLKGKGLRILSLKITDLNGVVDIPAYLRSCGVKALAQQQSVYAVDGEVSQYSQYSYGTDYFLGDLVEMRGSNGISNTMMVTEQTFVQDENGFRSYPTMVVNQIVTPGSWLSALGNGYWANAQGYWADSQ